jgi:hypothetical protein
MKHSHDRIISLLEDDWVHKNTHDRIASLLEDDWVHKNILMTASTQSSSNSEAIRS